MVYHAHKVWVHHLQQQLDKEWLILLHQLVTLETQTWALNTILSETRCRRPPPNPHRSLHGVWQEPAYFPHSLLNLGFSRIFLQDAVNVDHGGLANLTVATDIEASLVQCS